MLQDMNFWAQDWDSSGVEFVQPARLWVCDDWRAQAGWEQTGKSTVSALRFSGDAGGAGAS